MSSIGTKPITLVTASPGGGKTAQVVALMQEALKQGRPLIQQGIPELKLDHGTVPPVADWTEMRPDADTGMDLPYFTFPPNALVVLDEAQRIYRTRPSGSKVPDHVAAFETVRHTGVTFILMTQHPSFLDSHIRKLVGQHIHLRDVGVLGRWYYEWPECEDHPDKTFNAAPIKKKFKLPKHVFGLYKSSSLHIKRKYSMPPVVLLLLAILLIVAVGGWRFYSSMQQKMAPAQQEAVQVDAKVVPASAPLVAPARPPAPSVSSNDGAEYLAAFVPAAPGHPESAPAYAELRQVRAMPVVAGGACNARRCVCYTQQGTDAGLDDRQCRDWLRKPPFDPYRAQDADGAATGTAERGPGGAPAEFEPRAVRG